MSDGFYSVNGPATHRVAQMGCPQGFYCVKGVRYQCGKTVDGDDRSPSPNAYYCGRARPSPCACRRATSRSTTATSARPSTRARASSSARPARTAPTRGTRRTAPSGATATRSGSPTRRAAAAQRRLLLPGGLDVAARGELRHRRDARRVLLLPPGTTERLLVGDLGFDSYTTPAWAPETNREGYAACESGLNLICTNGTRFPLLYWEGDGESGLCGAASPAHADVHVDENVAGAAVTAQTASYWKGEQVVTYSLVAEARARGSSRWTPRAARSRS